MKEEDDYRLYWKLNRSEYPFLVEVKGELASRIKLDFNAVNPQESSILLRNIPITTFYIDCISAHWDLWCRKADSLVNLSRDGLLPQGFSWFQETMEKIIPECIQLLYEPLLKELKQQPQNDLLIKQYCGLCFANWNLQQPIDTDLNPLKDYIIRRFESLETLYFIDNHGEGVSAKSVMETDKFVSTHNPHGVTRVLKENPSLFHEDEIIIADYNPSYIPSTFFCSEVFSIDYYYEFYPLINSNSNAIQWVADSNYDFKKLELKEEFSPVCYPGFRRYDSIVVGKDAPLLGYRKPFHCNCWIYPISKNVKEELPSSPNEAEQVLREVGRMDALVPDYIVKLIQKHNALGNKNLTKEEIHNTYIQLILDNKFGVKKATKAKSTNKKVRKSSKAKK